MKRLFDLVIVVPSLILFSPLMLMVSIGIKLTSPGPVLFRQQRVGRYGRTFRICKFRTMVPTPPGTGPQVTARSDPRITPLGRFLRGSKLDELPQLFNVLRGEMTLVGPRPQVPRFVSHYPAPIRTIVLSVRPGITDPAAIAYRNEEEVLAHAEDPERSYIDTILPHKLRMYVQYIRRQTLTSDLLVILLTLACVARRRHSDVTRQLLPPALRIVHPSNSQRAPVGQHQIGRRFAIKELV